MNAVKQERHDEAEIQELAAKLVEANKAKMANPARPPPPPVTSMNILSFLTSDKAKTSKLQNSVSLTTVTETNKTVDEDSVRGKFGWTSLGKVHIPFIIRSGEHYCSVRMVEMKVLNKLLNFLHQDLYNCTNIRSYYITESEARLLNEINFKHCDYQFGREQFTTRDLIVRLADANEFYQFLGHCYNKLVSAVEADSLDRCGFIRINRESVVPYTVYNEQKYVPLFYFEGETDNLKQRADKLEGWDLSYLKFCCKVQGIRNELFAHDSCSVISLNDIKNYFPPGTLFEDYWPKKNLDSQLLISGNSRSQAQIVQWTRKPTAPPMPSHPPPSPKPATQAKAANNSQLHNVHVYSNYNIGAASATGGQPPYHSPQPRTASSAVRATYPSAATRNMRPSTSYYASMAQAPPALVRSTAQASYTNAQTNSGASNYMILDPSINQTNFHQPSQLNKYPPPPLLHMNGAIPSPYDRDLAHNYGVNSSQAQLINQQPAHQATRAQTTTPVNDDRNSLTNGRMSGGMNSIRKLKQIPEQPTNHIPYKLVPKEIADGKIIQCIPMKNYQNSNGELLVTLPDLVANFFHNVSVQSCQQVMQVLGIELYKPNSSQLRVLLENGKCGSVNEAVPLVQVRNVIDFMPQLKYMLNIPEIAAKRQRTS
ncbi:unnamed protein product [Brassicogethes aeneus]|uniref:Uncharacterized protein n=1 Tax=Brassicogethes aeneus TaxID=1431903 RepID=A0A9P0BFQ5_BRAAE|nr:unnamed protein product [Brassicogethes aeneus]